MQYKKHLIKTTLRDIPTSKTLMHKVYIVREMSRKTFRKKFFLFYFLLAVYLLCEHIRLPMLKDLIHNPYSYARGVQMFEQPSTNLFI